MNLNWLAGSRRLLATPAQTAIVWAVLHSVCLWGQANASGAAEVAAYGGVNFGQLSTHPIVGASSGISLSKYSTGFLEASYTPLGSDTLRDQRGLTAARSGLFDFNLSLRIHVPFKHRWAAYTTLSAAALYNTYSIATSAPGTTTYRAGYSDTSFGFEMGGGVRYYVKEYWGVQGEYRYTVSTHNFSRILSGVFYQFDDMWPVGFRRFKKTGKFTDRE